MNIAKNCIFAEERTESEMTIEKRILENVKNLETFNVGIIEGLLAGDASLDRTRLNWYLAKLAGGGSIVRIGRGMYRMSGPNRVFLPGVSDETILLFNRVQEWFPDINICVYEGPWISRFMHHLASNQITYVEVEKDVVETVFHRLRDSGQLTYLRPDKQMIYNYIDMDRPAVFVKNLITESPLQTMSDIRIPTLEKLLVDMYCDPDFYYLQESEYFHIMHNARIHFAINVSRLLRYARRRGASDEIKKIFENSQNDID